MNDRKFALHITVNSETKAKLIYIAKKDSRTLANYISLVLYQQIVKYEKENGDIMLSE